ncbi:MULTISPECIES: hypothetical protein [Spirulina sp. CCY15215]|uniref:hypothetical protein n=1 Tax=Spirulina sp. CCY15215 TaxID=2767591 RepID=UPI00194F4DC4|nr:hypothetical protein [Spirulina major]
MTFLNNSDRQTLKELIKESIREVLKEEQWNLYTASIPYVDDEEQNEIDRPCMPTDNAEEFVKLKKIFAPNLLRSNINVGSRSSRTCYTTVVIKYRVREWEFVSRPAKVQANC